MQRRGAEQRMRRARLKIAVEGIEPGQDARHQANRIAAFARAAAVRGAPLGFDLDPLEAFVRDGYLQIGRLGDDGRVGAPAADQRVGADAGVLLVHDAGDHQLAGRESAGLRDHTRDIDHRRDAALHVLRAAAVDAAVALDRIERRPHAGHADGVDVAAEHQRSAGHAPVECADDVGPAGSDVLRFHTEAEATHCFRDAARNRCFTRRSGHERRIHRIDRDQLSEKL